MELFKSKVSTASNKNRGLKGKKRGKWEDEGRDGRGGGGKSFSGIEELKRLGFVLWKKG